MKHKPVIGAFVLESLTSGMYTNPFDCIREYIQNSYDSIFSGQKKGLFNKNSGLITISINPEKRNIIIRDNGIGIPSSQAAHTLLNIGMSNKYYGEDAGFRGIGRLAGIAYCKRLVFKTSVQSEDECSMISFDCEGIRASISPTIKKVAELVDVVERYSSQDLIECKKSDHYFEVCLEEILPGGDKFLDPSEMENYLSQVAPVEYDSQKFLFAPKIEKWARDNGIHIPYIKLVIKSPDIERQIFKPYRGHYKTKKKDYDIRIKDVAFYPEVIDENTPFWLWYSITDLLGMFGDDRVAGLRFRRDNIAIGGPDRIAELFPGNEGRLNYWTMGEIHVLDSSIIPNARRDGFETNDSSGRLRELLEPFIKSHCKKCHDASSASQRPTVKILSSATSLITAVETSLNNGLSSKEEREELIYKLDKEEQKIDAAIDKRKTEKDRIDVRAILEKIKSLKETLENEKEFTIKKIKTSLDRKQRKVLRDVMEIVNSALSEMPCSKNKQCLNHVKASILDKFQVNNKC